MSSSIPTGAKCEPDFMTDSIQTPQYSAAMGIVSTLSEAGFSAYFAGGWVRDIYAGRDNDDIDIVTDAPAKKIQQLFPKTTDQGLDYGVVFVVRGEEIFEVATFRKDGEYTNGRSPDSVEAGSMKDDALRRDFTVNALYYNPISGETFDYTEGISDIDSRIIRSIGDPFVRLEEDLLRVMRAIRFSTKLEFEIEDETMAAIKHLAPKIFPSLSKQKVWKELKKMSHYQNFGEGLIKMYDTGVLQQIFPKLKGISRLELLKSVQSIDTLPKRAPLIVKILQLVPEATKEEAITICRDLELSRKEGIEVVNDYYAVRELTDDSTDYDWAMAYAKHRAELFVPETRESRARITKLQRHITRIKAGKPVVSANDLKSQGLDPKNLRRKFSNLLAEAEQIAVNNDLSTPEEVLPFLKQSDSWPS